MWVTRIKLRMYGGGGGGGVWNNVQILGVKLNTCSSTGDGRMCGCSQKLTAVQGALIPPQLGNHNKPLLGENLYRA